MRRSSQHRYLAAVLCAAFLGGVPAAAYATQDANEDCSGFPATEASPGFRATLPDCRAYEMVTPTFEGGSPVRWTEFEPPLISEDGERLLGVSIAAFGGTENDEQIPPVQTGALYAFQRTSSGWVTEPLDPPAPLSPRNNEFQTASSDLSKSLWTMPVGAPPGEELLEPIGYEYAVREGSGTGARFVRVGPSNSPGDPTKYNELLFAGASSDLHHVLFSIFPEEPGQGWPGDTTLPGDRSLYEYVGTGNKEPRLVGVRNQGPLAGAHVNENAELISNCGTTIGSEFQSNYNAMSDDGETIFFTASPCENGPPTAELYARIGGAKTVAISEPTTGPSGDCEECDESSPAEAIFQGASRDGSRAFFLSSQPGLLPGAEGQNLYVYDFAKSAHHKLMRVSAAVAEPHVLGVARISEDGSRVYYVAEAALAGANKEGREPQPGAPNLYEYEYASARTKFVATLSPEDAGDWSITDARPVQATPDGSWLVFKSAAQLTSDDKSPEASPQLFEFSAAGETLVRVSIGQKGSFPCATTGEVENGFACDGNTTTLADAPKMFAPPFYAGSRPLLGGLAVADDGTVFFSSLAALTPESQPGGQDSQKRIDRENVYEYRNGNVYLLSPAVEPAPLATLQSHFLGASAFGTDAFFFTTLNLVPEDQDTQASWYDARLGGGFTPASSPAGCSDDACQGALSASPPAPVAGGSAVADGSGNLAPPAAPVKPPPKKLTNAQKLTKALKSCRTKQNRKKRRACETKARRSFGARKASKSTANKGVKR